jgi:hypothetical protein
VDEKGFRHRLDYLSANAEHMQRRAFMQLPLEYRRQIMEKQMEELACYYEEAERAQTCASQDDVNQLAIGWKRQELKLQSLEQRLAVIEGERQ